MKWNLEQLCSILPQRMRREDFRDVRELRLRLGQKPRFVMGQRFRDGEGEVTAQELRYVVNVASRYSPWNTQTLAQGYLTGPGGHRLGICGDGAGDTLREVTSICIRIARDYEGIAAGLPTEGNLLILGAPGSGKTTLLRDYVRQRARRCQTAVVDERRELFPDGFRRDGNLDVLSGIPKQQGMDMLIRTMSPQVLAVDEITSESDCRGLLHAARCGVELVATAHAQCIQDLKERPVYKPLWETGLFTKIAILSRDQTWHIREVMPCCG